MQCINDCNKYYVFLFKVFLLGITREDGKSQDHWKKH